MIRKFTALILAALIAFLVGCSRLMPEPDGAVPERISVSFDNGSIFWHDIVTYYFRGYLNQYARYRIVADNQRAPYTLTVKLRNNDQTFHNDPMDGGMKSVYRVEADVQLLAGNRVMWTWAGYGIGREEKGAVRNLAKRASVAMQRDGMLDPQRFNQ